MPHLGGDTVWYMYKFNNGVLESVERGMGRANAPAADYTSDADYDFFIKTMTGEMSTAKALTTGEIKLKGNLMKALKLLDTHNILTEQKKLNGKTEW